MPPNVASKPEAARRSHRRREVRSACPPAGVKPARDRRRGGATLGARRAELPAANRSEARRARLGASSTRRRVVATASRLGVRRCQRGRNPGARRAPRQRLWARPRAPRAGRLGRSRQARRRGVSPASSPSADKMRAAPRMRAARSIAIVGRRQRVGRHARRSTRQTRASRAPDALTQTTPGSTRLCDAAPRRCARDRRERRRRRGFASRCAAIAARRDPPCLAPGSTAGSTRRAPSTPRANIGPPAAVQNRWVAARATPRPTSRREGRDGAERGARHRHARHGRVGFAWTARAPLLAHAARRDPARPRAALRALGAGPPKPQRAPRRRSLARRRRRRGRQRRRDVRPRQRAGLPASARSRRCAAPRSARRASPGRATRASVGGAAAGARAPSRAQSRRPPRLPNDARWRTRSARSRRWRCVCDRRSPSTCSCRCGYVDRAARCSATCSVLPDLPKQVGPRSRRASTSGRRPAPSPWG